MARAPLRVFYSYSHKDRRMLERLYAHMVMLRREGLIIEWYDGAIDAGTEWRGEIARELEAADVILLLVSADFLLSEFCYDREMVRAVERAHRGDATVIGVMLRSVEGWDRTPFAEFQVVPQDGRAISKWSNADDAYTHVVEKIRAAIHGRLEAGRRAPSLAPRSPAGGRPEAAATEPAHREPRSPATPADDDHLSEMELAALARIARPQGTRIAAARVDHAEAVPAQHRARESGQHAAGHAPGRGPEHARVTLEHPWVARSCRTGSGASALGQSRRQFLRSQLAGLIHEYYGAAA